MKVDRRHCSYNNLIFFSKRRQVTGHQNFYGRLQFLPGRALRFRRANGSSCLRSDTTVWPNMQQQTAALKAITSDLALAVNYRLKWPLRTVTPSSCSLPSGLGRSFFPCQRAFSFPGTAGTALASCPATGLQLQPLPSPAAPHCKRRPASVVCAGAN